MAKLMPHLILQVLHLQGQFAPQVLSFAKTLAFPIHASSVGSERHRRLARNLVEQDLVVLVATKVPRSQQHVLAVKMVGHTLSCISKSAAQRCREVILPLYLSLVRPHLKRCVQFGLTIWTLSLWRYTKMVMELEHTR